MEAGANHEEIVLNHKRLVRELAESQQVVASQAASLKELSSERSEIRTQLQEAETASALRQQDIEHLKREAVHHQHERNRLQAEVERLEASLMTAKEKKRQLQESMDSGHAQATRA